MDTDGRLLAACVSPAFLHDSQGGIKLLRASREHWPFLQRCFVESAYAGLSISTDVGSRGNVNIQCVTALISVETHR